MEDPAHVESLRAEAWAAEHAGGREHAAKLFRQILKDHPDSFAAKDALLYFATNHDPGPPGAGTLGSQTGPPLRVTVVDLDISFGQLVSLFVKASVALIPAAIILGILGFVAFAMLAGVSGSL